MVIRRARRRIRQTPGELFFSALNYVLLALIGFITLYPFLNQLALALTSEAKVYTLGAGIIPKDLSFDAFEIILQYKLLWTGFSNSILRVVLAVSIGVLITALMAYPLSKRSLPGMKGVTGFILVTMIFSGGMIPSYLLVKDLGLMNKIWSLVLPGLTGAFYVLIIRNFFLSIPSTLEEAARIDGAGHFRVFFRIILPLSVPSLATIALWMAVAHWNEWFNCMIYIQDPSKYVLQMVIRKIIIELSMNDIQQLMRQTGKSQFSNIRVQATTIIVSIIPMLLAYVFVQKYFTKGIMLGAVKG